MITARTPPKRQIFQNKSSSQVSTEPNTSDLTSYVKTRLPKRSILDKNELYDYRDAKLINKEENNYANEYYRNLKLKQTLENNNKYEPPNDTDSEPLKKSKNTLLTKLLLKNNYKKWKKIVDEYETKHGDFKKLSSYNKKYDKLKQKYNIFENSNASSKRSSVVSTVPNTSNLIDASTTASPPAVSITASPPSNETLRASTPSSPPASITDSPPLNETPRDSTPALTVSTILDPIVSSISTDNSPTSQTNNYKYYYITCKITENNLEKLEGPTEIGTDVITSILENYRDTYNQEDTECILIEVYLDNKFIENGSKEYDTLCENNDDICSKLNKLWYKNFES